ncbi:MAG: sensor domain-containing protein [Casimicrobium sp.]
MTNSNRSNEVWLDVLEPRTYMNLFYLLIGFPLGIGYFVLLLTGLATGLGLLIVWVGIPILLACVGLVWLVGKIELGTAKLVLGETLEDHEIARDRPNQSSSGWTEVRAYVSSLMFWKTLGLAFLKFPLGIVSFVVTIVLVTASLGLLAAPLYYNQIDVQFWNETPITTLWQALALSATGAGLLMISARVLNIFAEAQARLCKALLEPRVR